MQALRTGLGLMRASQLTMVRFQLALYKSNRRTAMQALDNLLDIDAELEGLAATLTGIPAHLADEAALPDFIGLQRTAIAAEKHALTGGDWRGDTKAIAIAAAGNGADATDFPAQPLPSDDDVESDNQAGRSEEHTSELQSLMRISYAVFCLEKKTEIHTPFR